LPTVPGSRAGSSDRGRDRLAATRALRVPDDGIALEVVDGPMDGLFLAGAFDSVPIGRVSRRAGELFFELYLDSSVSGRHAVFSRTGDPKVWRIEDRDSTNGTLVADEDIRGKGPREIPLGAAFMVGHSVLRSAPGGGGGGLESFAVDAERLKSESARLVGRLVAEAAQGYGAAVALAIAEQRPYLSDRHLFLGLSTMCPELPLFARAGGPLGPRFLSEVLWRNEYFAGAESWIHRRLRALSTGVQVLSKDDVSLTPRLLRLLLAAEAEAEAAGAADIRPEDLFRAFLAGPENRPRQLLERESFAPAALLSLLGEVTPSPKKPAEKAATGPLVPPAPEAPPAPTSGDPALDARAQEIARRLYGVVALYHLAAAEDRREAVRQLLRQELAQVPREGRSRLLRQLRRLFPLTPSAVEALAALAAATREPGRPAPETPAERRSGGSAPAAAAGTPIPWSALLAKEGQVDFASLEAEDRAALAFLRDLFVFGIDIESFIVKIVQSSRFSGPGTEQVQLPGFRTSLGRYAKEVAAGKDPKRETLEDYLAAIKTWLIATFAAYQEAPDLWFKDFWRKASPTAIEARAADAKSLLPLGNLGLWNRYKEQVKSISPDLVADEILQLVKKRAAEHYQVYERRKPS
jgi:FHA domain